MSMSIKEGDVVLTTWGTGRVKNHRLLDDIFIIHLDNWQLAQGQSPTLFLGRDALSVVSMNESSEEVNDKENDAGEDTEEKDVDEDEDDDLELPTLMRHITIEEDSLPPLPLMIRLASHNAEMEKMQCCICDELVLHGVGHLRLGCRCLCHESCFVSYIRSKSRADWGRAGGIACPYALGAEMCSFKGQNNEAYRITPNDLGQLVKLLGCADRLSATAEEFMSDSLITLDEIEKFESWILEFRQAGNVLVDDSDKDLIFTPADEATKALIDATTKACPKCSLRATHYHGHSCHHIYGGCEGCNEEYCYRCLSTATENETERHDRTLCPCGSWETFCNSEDLCFFLVCKPYPHDSRCGCTICPECRHGEPCDMCDGSCVVCDGLIEPAPLNLEALDDWEHNCAADELEPGSIYISGAMIQDVNGVYVPDEDEDEEGIMPTYIKKQYEDDDGYVITLKCAEMDGNYCWRIDKEDCDTATAYVKMDMNNICLPNHNIGFPWNVNINGVFQERPEVCVCLVQPDVELPAGLLEHFEVGKSKIIESHQLYLAELMREPRAGSVNVSGLPLDKANGVYEPSADTVNDMPVYRCKGRNAFSLEFAIDIMGATWRFIEAEKPVLAYNTYCVPNDADIKHEPIMRATLPYEQMDRKAVWMVLGDCNYEIPATPVDVSLYHLDIEAPVNLIEAKRIAQVHIDAYVKQKTVEDARAPIDGSLVISVPSSEKQFPFHINMLRFTGTFEPTCTLINGYPVYAKKGVSDTTLEYVSNKRWVIKAPVVKVSSSSLNIVAKCDMSGDYVLPTQSDNSNWKFGNVLNEFELADYVSVFPTSKILLPPEVLDLLTYEVKLKLREPLPGSVVVKGATGSRGGRVNGIFEPTDEVYNDMPVYLKKGDSGTWLELVTGTTGNLRWYVKPTANRGSSSVCFGYIDQDKTNLHLPHEVGDKVWHVYDGTAFTTQNNVTSSLVDPEIPIPEAMLTLLEKKRDVLAVAVAEREALMAIPPVPGSFCIERACGSRAYGVNGIFEPTAELQNGMPCYKKKGEEIWVEMVQGASGYRWYIKPTANRGSSSVCFAYCKFNEEEPALPFQRDIDPWMVYDGKEFSVQDAVTTELVPEGIPVPDDQLSLLAACKITMQEKAAEKLAQMAIPPLPGSLTLKGAKGSREHRVNGIFEPTDEEQNGMPVYRKKGDDDTWMELVSGGSGLRWYIKPTKEKGTSSVCYAYRGVNPDNINLPQNCVESGWNVYEGKAFAIQPELSCELSCLDVPIPQRMLEMVEAKKLGVENNPTSDAAKQLNEKSDLNVDIVNEGEENDHSDENNDSINILEGKKGNPETKSEINNLSTEIVEEKKVDLISVAESKLDDKSIEENVSSQTTSEIESIRLPSHLATDETDLEIVKRNAETEAAEIQDEKSTSTMHDPTVENCEDDNGSRKQGEDQNGCSAS